MSYWTKTCDGWFGPFKTPEEAEMPGGVVYKVEAAQMRAWVRD